MEIFYYVLVALVSATVGVLIYRNNVKNVAPKFDKFDEKIKPLVDKVNEIAEKVEQKVK